MNRTVLILITITVSLGFLLSSCAKKVNDEALARYLSAQRAYEAGKLDSAKEDFLALYRVYKGFYQAGFMAGKSEFFLGDLASATILFHELGEKFPEFTDAVFWEGRTLLQLGELDRARNIFERMLSYSSQDPRILYQLGIVAVEMEDYPSALEYFRKAELFTEDMSQIHIQLGRLYYQLGLPGEAKEELSIASMILPENHNLQGGLQSLIDRITNELQEEHQ